MRLTRLPFLLSQETTSPAELRTQFIIHWIVERQQLPQFRGQPASHFGAQQLRLILLLRHIAPTIKTVQGQSWFIGVVGCAAVPKMRIHYDDGSGSTDNQLF